MSFFPLVPLLLICEVNVLASRRFSQTTLLWTEFCMKTHFSPGAITTTTFGERDIWRTKTRWRMENRWSTNEHFQGQQWHSRGLVTHRPRMRGLICLVLLACAFLSTVFHIILFPCTHEPHKGYSMVCLSFSYLLLLDISFLSFLFTPSLLSHSKSALKLQRQVETVLKVWVWH